VWLFFHDGQLFNSRPNTLLSQDYWSFLAPMNLSYDNSELSLLRLCSGLQSLMVHAASYVLRGVLSAGSRSGSWVRMAGTSVASPRVARAAAKCINETDLDARIWSEGLPLGKDVPVAYPFPLEGGPEIIRFGAGATSIPVFRKASD